MQPAQGSEPHHAQAGRARVARRGENRRREHQVCAKAPGTTHLPDPMRGRRHRQSTLVAPCARDWAWLCVAANMHAGPQPGCQPLIASNNEHDPLLTA